MAGKEASRRTTSTQPAVATAQRRAQERGRTGWRGARREESYLGLEGRALCREGREGNVLIINIQISLLQSNTLIFFFFLFTVK